MKRWLLCCIAVCLSGWAAAGELLLPRPAELAPDVQFWIRVYSEISTNEGFIHDQHRLSVVYETLHFAADMPPRERSHQVDAERQRFAGILTRLAHGAAPADDEERRVRALWGDEGTPIRLEQAAQDVRFQLGQSDRFRAGLERSGAWETHIAEVFANLGLPAEIAALPHVESSFDPSAHSKVGAAGLWQFMRTTGRRFLRIDAAVDERLDPFRETEAAAQLLSYNYRLLGSWPLAITAYNHGADGVRRAREQLGTDDIVRIVRDYRSPSFGFASRNFYVSFLAALTIAQNPDTYFSGLERAAETEFRELKMPCAANAAVLARTLGIDRDALRNLNPALRPAVWKGQRTVPAGYVLRVPANASNWSTDLLAQRLGAARAVLAASLPPASAPPPASRATPAVAAARSAAFASSISTGIVPFGAPDEPQYYVVGRDDTIPAIVASTGLSLRQLMTLNSLRDQGELYEGQRLRLAEAVPEPETVTTAATIDAAKAAVQESREEQLAEAAAKKTEAGTEPVSKAQAQAEGPQLVPGATGPESADPVDYSVAADGTIEVVAAETLGHYADWLGSSSMRLRALNHLRARTPVVLGRRIRLEFTAVAPAQFEQRRRDYHRRLQAAYFASHRIAGSQVYIVRRGDSLWSITERHADVPLWLLEQYNPDLDFANLRPGTQISLPQVEDVSGL